MDTKIGDLVLKPIPEGDDLLPLVDVSVDETKKIDIKSLWDSQENRFSSPDFFYDGGGNLTSIVYGDGSTKTFSYSLGKLQTIDFQITGYLYIKRKTFIYSGDTLIRVDSSIV